MIDKKWFRVLIRAVPHKWIITETDAKKADVYNEFTLDELKRINMRGVGVKMGHTKRDVFFGRVVDQQFSKDGDFDLLVEIPPVKDLETDYGQTSYVYKTALVDKIQRGVLSCGSLAHMPDANFTMHPTIPNARVHEKEVREVSFVDEPGREGAKIVEYGWHDAPFRDVEETEYAKPRSAVSIIFDEQKAAADAPVEETSREALIALGMKIYEMNQRQESIKTQQKSEIINNEFSEKNNRMSGNGTIAPGPSSDGVKREEYEAVIAAHRKSEQEKKQQEEQLKKAMEAIEMFKKEAEEKKKLKERLDEMEPKVKDYEKALAAIEEEKRTKVINAYQESIDKLTKNIEESLPEDTAENKANIEMAKNSAVQLKTGHAELLKNLQSTDNMGAFEKSINENTFLLAASAKTIEAVRAHNKRLYEENLALKGKNLVDQSASKDEPAAKKQKAALQTLSSARYQTPAERMAELQAQYERDVTNALNGKRTVAPNSAPVAGSSASGAKDAAAVKEEGGLGKYLYK